MRGIALDLERESALKSVSLSTGVLTLLPVGVYVSVCLWQVVLSVREHICGCWSGDVCMCLYIVYIRFHLCP